MVLQVRDSMCNALPIERTVILKLVFTFWE